MVETLIHPEVGDKLKKYNPRKFEYVRKLLNPFRHSVRKLADPAVTVHEKRKTLKKAQVGEGVYVRWRFTTIPYYSCCKAGKVENCYFVYNNSHITLYLKK